MPLADWQLTSETVRVVCPKCEGEGRRFVFNTVCGRCGGLGWISMPRVRIRRPAKKKKVVNDVK